MSNESCFVCNGTGWAVVCIDDMCRDSGECMHGDGDVECGHCLGTGLALSIQEYEELVYARMEN